MNEAYRNPEEYAVSSRASADAERGFLNKVYNWMAAGLAISGLTAWYVAQTMASPDSFFRRNPGVFLGLIVAELILVMVLSAAVRKMAPPVAAVCFLVYSLLSGITLAPIFLVYTASSIYAAFFTCAGMFAATSIFGYMTKANLAGIGSFCFMALIGIVIATLVNFFIRSNALTGIISYVGVVVFIGLTAWDTQKLRQIAAGSGETESAEMKKLAILGALTLYLDFINLFLFLLRIFGGKRD